nr:mitochondrial folate transporter:carrier [Hymenolepis microstoma]
MSVPDDELPNLDEEFEESFRRYLSHLKWEQLAAGIAGGSVTTAILHPLELAKIRLQVNEGNRVVKTRPASSRLLGTLREVYCAKGAIGLYQGSVVNIVGNAVSWGLYFMFYGALKNYAQNGDTCKQLGSAEYLGLATISSTAVLWMTNPIWIAKTRICLQYETIACNASASMSSNRLTTWRCLYGIWQSEGIRGFYRGLLPGMFGVTSGALQFLLYEQFRNQYNGYHRRPIDTHLKAPEYLLMGIISKSLSTTLTYPFQVIRTRLQEQHRTYNSISCLLKSIWKFEGVRGYYKGLLPNLLRTAPACGLMFVVYENSLNYLTSH